MFAQIHYSQKLGHGQADRLATIGQAGCFLVSFSNLLERYGVAVDPPTLNDYFNSHDDYLSENDGGVVLRDLLAWGSVSSYDGTITPNRIVNPANGSWPETNEAIVKFIYTSHVTGKRVTHFCLVADWTQKTIVDSWDGVVKRSPYGDPVAWASYTRNIPQSKPAVASTPPPYTVEQISPKQVITNKQPTHKWGMNYDNFTAMANNPVGTVDHGTVLTVVALVRHNVGYTYYKTDVNDPDGWNTLDCDDWAPPPPEPEPQPQIEVAEVPTLPVPSLPLPDGPIGAPSTDKYLLVRDVPSYPTSGNAAASSNSNGKLSPGGYYICNQLNGMLSLTKTPGKPQGTWINPADNIEEVVQPTHPSWQDSYKPLNQLHSSVTYVVNTSVTIHDYTGVFPDIELKQYQEIGIYGTFVRDGMTYYRPRLNKDTNFQGWYGVPQINPGTGGAYLLLESAVYDTNTTAAERQVLGTTKLRDQIDLFEAKVKKFIAHGWRWFDIIPSGNKNKK